MFRNNLKEIFPFLKNIYDISELILIGSDIPSWLDILQNTEVDEIHYINQSANEYRYETLPQNWHVAQQLLAKEDGEVMHYELTNSLLNGTVSSELLSSIWKNLETLQSSKKDALSLHSFVNNECKAESSKMLVLDSFDGLNILNEFDSLELNVIVVRVVRDTEDSFKQVSNTLVEQQLVESGYKNIAAYEDNHPQVWTAVYVKDNKLQEKELNAVKTQLEIKNKALQEKQVSSEQLQKQKTELENKTKEYENNLNAVNEEVTVFKNKTKSLEENLQQIRSAKDASQKELSEIKTQLENKTKELATANQTKEQELAKLKSELETKNKVLQEKQANSEQLQKQKTELENKTKMLEENLIKEKTAKENLENELTSSKTEVELKNQEFTENLTRELKESEYILKQANKLVGIEDFSIVSLAEISQNAKDYKKAIQYWQQLASKLENRMPQIFYKRLLQVYEKIGGFPKGSEEEEQLKGSLDKHEVLRELHKILHPNLYLEIGVQTGKSLKLAECRAIGIDPMPMIKFELGINHELIEESSDNFFKAKAATILTEPIDFSFIDGMHLFEYALRDFMNVEKYSTKDTVVVMDDVYPGHEAQASRDRKTRAWTGDVWKVVSILKKYRPDLKITLLDVYPTGLMVIENLDNKNRILRENYKKIVKKYMNKKINNEKYIGRADSIKLEKLDELWKFNK